MYDVVVVGAGPAGSTAATVLAQRGCPVLLVDKSDFPRDKVCGDSIGRGSIQLLSTLGLDLEPEVCNWHTTDWIRVVSPSGMDFEAPFPANNGVGHQGYIIPRKEFDHILWEFALRQGAEFERLRVTEPVIAGGSVCGIRGQVNGRMVERRARVVIAADGANSVIAKFLRPGKAAARHYGVAMRGYFNGVQSVDHRAEFYFNGTGFPGYGWIFPLGGGLANVGFGLRLDVLNKNGRSLKRAFDRFIRNLEIAGRLTRAEQVGRIGGWPLPFASQRIQRVHPGAILVGDAGAFVSPLTGAGIYNALESGRLAAEVALESLQEEDGTWEKLHQFEVKWRNVIGGRLRIEIALQRLLGWPSALNLLIRQMHRSERFARFVLTKF